jgi:ribonuclease R
MLPPKLSEHEGSLVAGAERSAVVFNIKLDPQLAVDAFSISLRRIRVEHRISYSQLPEIIRTEDHPARDMLLHANTLASKLLLMRRAKGALAMYDLSRLFLTDEEGNLRSYKSVDEVVDHIIIQEMMILTNSLAAQYSIENGIPCLYRNHEPRLSAPPANVLAQIMEGWMQGGNFDDQAVRQQFSAVSGKANYSNLSRGHYGLNLPAYIHVTSPLRRYADLVNMRQLSRHLLSESLPYSSVELESLGNTLNETIERRKEERSEGLKSAVKRTAEKAIDSGTLHSLADHELRQAVKLSREAG